jgi:hypothetical protein
VAGHLPTEWSPYLKAGMTSEFQQRFHNTNMSLVDSNVERSLSTLIASIQICAGMCQQFHHTWLITKCRVMHRTITILVLHHRE